MGGAGRDEGEPLDELARELRRGAGAELRADAEAAEHDAALLARRRRDLAGVLREHMARGDEVTVAVPGLSVTGEVRHVAGDLVAVAAAGGRVDVRLTAAVLVAVAQPGAYPGSAVGEGPGSFVARLRELELAGSEVELGVPSLSARPRGHLAVVATDHVVLASPDGDAAVAVDGIRWLREP